MGHKYLEKLPVVEAIRSIAAWAYCDSLIKLDTKQLSEALNADVAASGRQLSEQDCEQFVIGTEDGEIPEELVKAYPLTHAFLAKHWE